MTLHKVAVFIFSMVSLCLTTSLSAQTPSPTLNNDAGRGNVTVPFVLLRGYLIVIEADVGSLGGRRLIVDTGTTSTVLDRSVARQLGLGGRESRLTLLNGDERVKTSILSGLTLGPITARSLPVFVADLSFFTRELGTRIDGIVGLDVLRASSFTIDYGAREIIFGPVQSSPAAVPFESGPPLVTVTMKIEGRPLRLLVDTGASGLLLFPGDQRWAERAAIVGEHASTTISGSFTREEVELSDMQLGGLRMPSHTAYVVWARKETTPDFQGLMGTGAMGLKEVAFDFEHNRLEVKMRK